MVLEQEALGGTPPLKEQKLNTQSTIPSQSLCNPRYRNCIPIVIEQEWGRAVIYLQWYRIQ